MKCSSAPTVSKGFHSALEDVRADDAFVVYPSRDRYPKGEGIDAIGPFKMATVLNGLERGVSHPGD